MIEIVKQLLDEYRQQLKADATSADQSLLETARKTLNDLLNRQFQEGCLETEAVHLANEVSYFFGGDKRFTVKVLSQYLTQPLTVEEDSWARWELIDNLAMLRQCEEVVTNHRDFLAWAREHLPQDRLLWVMYDGTQAFCWRAASKGDEWLQIFNDIMAVVTPSPENRYDRFIYLRTANRMYSELKKFEEALQIANRIRDLSEEDPTWESAFGVRIESYASEIAVHWKLQNVPEIRCIGQDASAELEAYRAQNVDLDFEQKRKLSTLYHNLAASLYFARQYDIAIPLFRSAINLGIWEHWTYSWLAASLWATTKSRFEVLSLLKQGSDRVVGNYDAWTRLPEFQDVVTDAEFLDAAKRQTD
jgi:tetratricopeptide (TPR) repeat protein